MATNKHYWSAGLAVAKNAGQAPTTNKNTYYFSAGLPAVVLTAGTVVPVMMHYYRNRRET